MAHILIVDDEEAISWALRKAFERQGHTVGVAASAEAALDLAAKLKPDAIMTQHDAAVSATGKSARVSAAGRRARAA